MKALGNGRSKNSCETEDRHSVTDEHCAPSKSTQRLEILVIFNSFILDEVILLKATDICISNTFKQSSSILPIFRKSGVIVESDYDTRFGNFLQ